MENYIYEQVDHHAETGMKYEVYDTDGFFNSKHWHNELEIIYLLEGKMTFDLDGKEKDLLPGRFIVVNSRTIHSVICCEKSRHMLIQIPLELLRQNVSDFGITSVNCYCQSAEKCVDEYVAVRDSLELLKEHFKATRDDGYLLKFNSLVYELLYRLVTGFKSVSDPVMKKKTDKNIERLGVVIQFARWHFAENISLNDAAETIGLNREYFARFFRKYMGMTFMDYVFAVRLEHVFNDILTTDYTIGEIADRNGFCHNYKLFVRKFKEQYGCSPGEVRKRIEAKNEKRRLELLKNK